MKDSFNKPNDVMLSAYFSELLDDDSELECEAISEEANLAYGKDLSSVELKNIGESPAFLDVQYVKKVESFEKKSKPLIEDVIEKNDFSSIEKLLTQVQTSYQPLVEEVQTDDEALPTQVETLTLAVETTPDDALDVFLPSNQETAVVPVKDSDLLTKEAPSAEYAWSNINSEDSFQVLFFEAFGVTYAVPLSQLGGIHHSQQQNKLIGRPDWHLGLQTENKKKLDIVDTARWVMSDKISEGAQHEDYSYVVILGDSNWALSCNHLHGTSLVYKERVKWRSHAGKRPWLAGLIKDKMCALIHVDALIAMLNQGYDASDFPDTENTQP